MGMDQTILAEFVEGSSDSPVVIMDIRLARPAHSAVATPIFQGHLTNIWISTKVNSPCHPCRLVEGLPTQSEKTTPSNPVLLRPMRRHKNKQGEASIGPRKRVVY